MQTSTLAYDELTKFCSQNRQRFINFLRRNVNDSNTEDILHDAFIKATQNLCKFRCKAKLSTWFSSILYNLVCDYYKDKHQSGQLQPEIVHSNSYHPLERYLQDELKCLLQKAINSLPNPSYRKIIKLRYYEHLQLTEIHKALDINYKATEMQHRRALKALRTLILKEPQFRGLLEYAREKGFKKCQG